MLSHFSSTAFKILFFSLALDSLAIVCLAEHPYKFILAGVHWVSCMYRVMSSFKWGRVWVIISSYSFCPFLSLSPPPRLSEVKGFTRFSPDLSENSYSPEHVCEHMYSWVLLKAFSSPNIFFPNLIFPRLFDLSIACPYYYSLLHMTVFNIFVFKCLQQLSLGKLFRPGNTPSEVKRRPALYLC